MTHPIECDARGNEVSEELRAQAKALYGEFISRGYGDPFAHKLLTAVRAQQICASLVALAEELRFEAIRRIEVRATIEGAGAHVSFWPLPGVWERPLAFWERKSP